MRDSLLQALLSATEPGDADPNCQLRFGTVTQVSPLLVKVGAATVGQPCSTLGSYAPLLNDYVAVLVRGADRVALGSTAARDSYGFKAWRSTNEASLANGGTRDITFDFFRQSKGNWPAAGSITPASTFTIPSDGAGLYSVTASLYWATTLGGVFAGVDVNGSSITSTPSSAATDRQLFSGVAYLSAGDVVRLHVANLSGSALTITAVSSAANTSDFPMLSVWRMTS